MDGTPPPPPSNKPSHTLCRSAGRACLQVPRQPRGAAGSPKAPGAEQLNSPSLPHSEESPSLSQSAPPSALPLDCEVGR